MFNPLDMFTGDNDWEKKLNSEIEKILGKDLGYHYDGMNLVDEIGCYKLSANGLEICYTPYMGPAPGGGFVCLTIPYENIDEFILPDSLLGQVLGEIEK